MLVSKDVGTGGKGPFRRQCWSGRAQGWAGHEGGRADLENQSKGCLCLDGSYDKNYEDD